MGENSTADYKIIRRVQLKKKKLARLERAKTGIRGGPEIYLWQTWPLAKLIKPIAISNRND
jgi:hypothetical protein